MPTMIEWYLSGGPTMPLLALVALVAGTILVERAYTVYVRGGSTGRAFLERVIQLVRAGKVDEAIKHCADARSALPDIGLVILRSRTRDATDLENVAEAASLAVIPRFRRRLDYLPLLTRLAVLLGILGLLLESHAALGSAAQGPDGMDSRALVAGLAIALRPLIAAIVVAIPTSVGHALVAQRADRIIADIHEFSARLVNALIDRPDVRLGHR
jgi:biopolymer transport protein ExbB